jgi:hypothetical protein
MWSVFLLKTAPFFSEIFSSILTLTNDVLSNLLLVAEESLVVLEGGEVAIHHLRMVPHPDSKPPAECGKSH